jgi:hypothetical protein
MASVDLREWAVKGAEQRLAEIADEARAIFQTFPELRKQGRGFELGTPGRKGARAAAAAGEAAPKRRRSRMSAAARKAVSARMKKYWAERRKQKG